MVAHAAIQRTRLLLYVVTMTVAAVDWIMSREPHWYSTILGLVICVSQALAALWSRSCSLRAARRRSSVVTISPGTLE